MKPLFARLRRPFYILGMALGLIVISAGIVIIIFTQRPPAQPIQFPHNLHVGLGIQCLYCHPGATWGPVAGLPTQSKCWGCHQQIAAQSTDLDKLKEYVSTHQSIPWVPVAIQPDFVHFNHSPHIDAGISCETCHGNVSKMTVAEPQKGQNMGWCLDCHKRKAPEKFTILSDCSTCHY